MSHECYLTLTDNQVVKAKETLLTDVQNEFTIEFWAHPKASQEIDMQTRNRIANMINKRFAITPVYGPIDGDTSRAGLGVSVGTNGVSVYEHSIDYFPATLVYETSLTDWTHIAIVYQHRRATLYLNGQLAKRGIPSLKRNVAPSCIFGGDEHFGSYHGDLKDIRIWSIAKKQTDIVENMNLNLVGNEKNLVSYWPLNESEGNIAYDLTSRKNHAEIFGFRRHVPIPEDESKSDKSLKILFTYYLPSGGVETLNRQRFYALKDKQVNCHYLYLNKGIGLQNELDAPTFITSNDAEIKEILTKENYDAIVVGSDFYFIKKLREIGYSGILIYEIQGLGVNIDYASQFLKNQTLPILNKYCDAILIPKTPHLIQAFQDNFPTKDTYTFHNCFNTKIFSYQQHPKLMQPVIGWVGRLEDNKNWKDFLLIGAELIKDNHDIKLWMFEDNTLSTIEERKRFEQMVDKLNLRDHLIIFANQPHLKMAEHFSKIGDSGGFLCSTSKVEGFGYAVLEAMICRCPVLSTESDGVSSFITHNKTGKYFQLGNVAEAVKEGKELMENHELREAMRTAGAQHIEANFSLEPYAEHFLTMINDLKQKKAQ